MSFGAGMAAGLGVGIGSGIAIGISAGQSQTRTKIRDHAQLQRITLQDAAGKPVDWEPFLDEAVGCQGGSNKRAAYILAILVGLTLLAAGAGLLLWLL